MPLSRGAGAPLLGALAGHFHPVLLTRASWPGGTIREHTGRGTLAWDGDDYEGNGRFVGWEAPQEETALPSADATVHFAAKLDETRAVLGTDLRGRGITLWFGCTTTAGGATLIGDPVLHLAGTIASRKFLLRRQGEDYQHDLLLGVTLGPWARAVASILHSYEDQMAAFPGDTAGRHTQNLAKKRSNAPQWPER